jgi:hypothetical protein
MFMTVTERITAAGSRKGHSEEASENPRIAYEPVYLFCCSWNVDAAYLQKL